MVHCTEVKILFNIFHHLIHEFNCPGTLAVYSFKNNYFSLYSVVLDLLVYYTSLFFLLPD